MGETAFTDEAVKIIEREHERKRKIELDGTDKPFSTLVKTRASEAGESVEIDNTQTMIFITKEGIDERILLPMPEAGICNFESCWETKPLNRNLVNQPKRRYQPSIISWRCTKAAIASSSLEGTGKGIIVPASS